MSLMSLMSGDVGVATQVCGMPERGCQSEEGTIGAAGMKEENSSRQ